LVKKILCKASQDDEEVAETPRVWPLSMVSSIGVWGERLEEKEVEEKGAMTNPSHDDESLVGGMGFEIKWKSSTSSDNTL
jgi:hypothetical protein